jgi:hypothetical protein
MDFLCRKKSPLFVVRIKNYFLWITCLVDSLMKGIVTLEVMSLMREVHRFADF